MNWAYSLLGVSPAADASEVKRAYARLLRSTRPDEDAEAFQHLHTAYQWVLAQVNGRQASVGNPSHQTSPAAATPGPTHPMLDERQDSTERVARATPADASVPVPPPFVAPLEPVAVANPLELARQVIRHAVGTNDENALSWWLSTLPEFWSIRIKQQTGPLLLQQLFREPQPMASTCLDALLQFFDLQQVLSGVNPIALAQLRQRQLAQWYLLPENHRALALRLNIPGNRSPDPRPVQACLRLLCSPLHWRSMLLPAIRQGGVATIARLLQGLCGGQLSMLPPQIDRRQAAFWYAAAQPGRFSRPRFVVGSVRAAFLALIVLLIVTAMITLSSLTGDPDPHWYAMLGIAGGMAAGVFSLWLIYAAWLWLDGWQGQPESASSVSVWWRRALIPALCAASLALDYLANVPVAALFVTMLTLILAVRRYRHRSPTRPGRRGRRLGASLPGVAFLLIVMGNAASNLPPGFFDQTPLIAILASTTMGIWLTDMWRHRRHLKARTT